ncbi:MAG: DNA primase [archaeon]
MDARLPEGMKPASLEQRLEYYKKEFDIKKVRDWFKSIPVKWQPMFAVIIGKETRIFPEEYGKNSRGTLLLDTAPSFKSLRGELLEFLPETVFYSRNAFSSWEKNSSCRTPRTPWKCEGFLGQELVVDIDPENFRRSNDTLSFVMSNFETARTKTLELYETLGFSKMKIVYSGRGFHLHVHDKETFSWDYRQRLDFSRTLSEKGFKNDEWVASGEYYMIRLPYSLHGLTGRVCIPLSKKETESFDPINNKRCTPKFLK